MLRLKRRMSLDDFAKVSKPLDVEEMRTYVGGVAMYDDPTRKMNTMPPVIDPNFSGGNGGNGSYDSPYQMDEVGVVGHRPESSGPRVTNGYTYAGKYAKYMELSGGPTYGVMPGDMRYSSGGGGCSGSTNHSDQTPLTPTLLLSSAELEQMRGSMDENLYKVIKIMWKKGALKWNTDPSKKSFPAYYSPKDDVMYVSDPAIVSEHTIAHEYVHYLQDMKGKTLSPKGSDIGDLNNEMQADLLASICGFGYYGDFMTNTWLDDKTKKEFKKGLEKDSNNHISITKELWDKLHDNNYMQCLQQAWMTHWCDKFGDTYSHKSNTYLDGEQCDWNYDWEYYFDKLGIKHP